MQERRFREDLFYHLHVWSGCTCPLRERGSECMLLPDHLVQRFR